MTTEQIVLLAGILFLLIAVLGGGFAIREIRLPRAPGWARAVSALVGLAFLGLFVAEHFGAAPLPGPAPEPGEAALLHRDDTPDLSRHGLRLSALRAAGERRPPRVGDILTVSFRLENASENDIAFAETFVAARDPAGANRDFGHGQEGRVLSPGASLAVSASLVPDAAGAWTIWPCYRVEQGGESEEAYCPGRWRAFLLRVEE
ncbi:MAG: hypothetical protein ACQEUZ_10820 [Pseudomonadota bacterium]